MLQFYYVDKKYADYLRKFDKQVPSLNYDSHDKFFCGIVLKIGDIKYYAPISHETRKQQTNIIITDKGVPISSIKFCFMIPVPNSEITKLDFREIAKTDKAYADLLEAEYKFCKKNKTAIYNKAKSVYRIGSNEKHRLNYTCCKFKVLEKHMKAYIKSQVISNNHQSSATQTTES